MDAKLRVYVGQKQMHVVGHYFHFDQLEAHLSTHAEDYLLETGVDRRNKHLAAVLRAEHDMVFAVEGNIGVGIYISCHTRSI
jgi:hypothetical protein